MNEKENNKGITIIALVITIIVLLILSSIVLSKINQNDDVGKYNKMTADIKMLEDKILVYYSKYGEIPVILESEMNFKDISDSNKTSQININDNDIYYKIALDKLENITLNYGKAQEENDIYIINQATHTVYYLKGIELENNIYYRYSEVK